MLQWKAQAYTGFRFIRHSPWQTFYFRIKIRKEHIIDAAIDLFAKHGVRDVPIEKIAKKVGVSRSNIYYHFKDGKEEIIENILAIFDQLIQNNTPNQEDWMNIKTDAGSILSKLFFEFKEEDSSRCRKINRIIFSDQHYIKKIGNYMIEQIYYNREARLEQCFAVLIKHDKVKPFNTEIAARLINRSLIAYAMEDSYCYPFKKISLPDNLNRMQDDCMFVVHQILNGNFP